MRNALFLFLLILGFFAAPLAAEQAPPAKSSTIHMLVRTAWPRKVGQPVDCYLYLWTDSGPIKLEDMKEMQNNKLHLLLLSPDFKTFYHAYPIATGGEGEFRFTFQPQNRDPLRIWALFTTKAGRQVVFADLNGETAPPDELVPPQIVQSEAEDIIFTIHFPQQIRALHPTDGMIYAIYKNSHLPFKELEPVLGSYTYIAPFSADYQTLYEAYPLGPQVPDSAGYGGPSIKFHIVPERAGLMRLIAQFKARGNDLLVPFTVRVAPAVPPPHHHPENEEETPPLPPDSPLFGE